MVNEAARILEEGIVDQASDVDLVWLHGFGFPRYRGGPLYWADQVGAAAILDGIRAFGAVHGTAFWTPAPLLERLAAEGRGFHGAPGAAPR
jgi:3-hydroxyacyl-CoA dehydrogenase